MDRIDKQEKRMIATNEEEKKVKEEARMLLYEANCQVEVLINGWTEISEIIQFQINLLESQLETACSEIKWVFWMLLFALMIEQFLVER